MRINAPMKIGNRLSFFLNVWRRRRGRETQRARSGVRRIHSKSGGDAAPSSPVVVVVRAQASKTDGISATARKRPAMAVQVEKAAEQLGRFDWRAEADGCSCYAFLRRGQDATGLRGAAAGDGCGQADHDGVSEGEGSAK